MALDNNFKAELAGGTIQENDVSFDDVVSYFIESQGLEEICKNPRGREKIASLLGKVFKKMNVESKDGVYDMSSVEQVIDEAVGKISSGRVCLSVKPNEIVYSDSDYYEFDTFRDDGDMAPGYHRTTLSINEYGELKEVEEGRSSYPYNMKPGTRDNPTPLSYSRRESVYEDTGLQITQQYTSCRYDDAKMNGTGYDKKPLYETAILDDIEAVRHYEHGRFENYRRTNGVMADVQIYDSDKGEKNGRCYLNNQYGVDDIHVNTGIGGDLTSVPPFEELNGDAREQYDRIAKDGISKSKYKEALVAKTPGIDMEDIENELNRE